jgi:hypothetical protein
VSVCSEFHIKKWCLSNLLDSIVFARRKRIAKSVMALLDQYLLIKTKPQAAGLAGKEKSTTIVSNQTFWKFSKC